MAWIVVQFPNGHALPGSSLSLGQVDVTNGGGPGERVAGRSLSVGIVDTSSGRAVVASGRGGGPVVVYPPSLRQEEGERQPRVVQSTIIGIDKIIPVEAEVEKGERGVPTPGDDGNGGLDFFGITEHNVNCEGEGKAGR